MKKIFALILLISFSVYGVAQIDVKKIVAEQKAVTATWVEILIGKKSWTLIKEGSWKNDKATALKNPIRDNNIVFSTDSTFSSYNSRSGIKFFPSQNTFYTGKNYDEYWDMGVSVVNQVLYIDSSFLIIRKVPFFLFEKETGRIMTMEEFYKFWNEKKKNQPEKEFHFTNYFAEPKSVLLEVYKAN